MIKPDLAWVKEIMEHPHWPKMEALLFGDIAVLLNISLVVKKDSSAGVHSALKKCGLDVPQTQEEQLRVYLALRTVIGYLTEKKKQIDTMKQAHINQVRKGVEDGTLTPEPQTTLRGH